MLKNLQCLPTVIRIKLETILLVPLPESSASQLFFRLAFLPVRPLFFDTAVLWSVAQVLKITKFFTASRPLHLLHLRSGRLSVPLGLSLNDRRGTSPDQLSYHGNCFHILPSLPHCSSAYLEQSRLTLLTYLLVCVLSVSLTPESPTRARTLLGRENKAFISLKCCTD